MGWFQVGRSCDSEVGWRSREVRSKGLKALVATSVCTMEMEGPLGWSTER